MTSRTSPHASRCRRCARPSGRTSPTSPSERGTWDRYGAADALVRLRDGIRRLNLSIGGANTPSSGYHETITAAYVTLLAALLDTCPELPLADRIVRLLTSPLADRDMLFTFYSRERLLSIDARARWVDPDLAPLRLDAVAGRPEPA